MEAGLGRRSRGDLSLVQRSGRSTRSRAEVVVADGGFFGTVVRAGSELRSTARTFGVWRAVAKRIRDLYDKKMIPEDLKTAIKGRSKLYLSTVGDAGGIADLAAERLPWRMWQRHLA